MKKILVLTLWALLPIGMSAASIVTDENGMRWIQDGSDHYILISESASETIDGTTYSASDFIPDANFRAFIRTSLATGSADRVYKDAMAGYTDFASVEGSWTLTTTNFTYTAGLEVSQDAGIADFTGIGYFHALKVLVIKPQGIAGTFNLDVTKNKSLEYLQAIDTEMKELDAHGLTSLVWLDLASTQANSPNTKLEIININDCSNLRGTALYYGNGTTQLGATRNNNVLYLSNTGTNHYNHIKKVYAKNCSTIKTMHCYMSLLEELDLTGCSNLVTMSGDHGLLTSDKVYLHGCKNLASFGMKRQKFTDLDFLLKPSVNSDGVERTAEDIGKLRNIQANGGSYWITEPFNMYRKDADGNPIYVTNAIKEFDATYLKQNVNQKILVANNLLTRLDLPDDIKANLSRFECDGNLMPTLDLAAYNYATSGDYPIVTIKAENQYLIADAEAVKGGEEDGSKDWVAVHFDGRNTAYSIKFPDGLDIYHNRWRSEQDPTNKLQHGPNAWICRISETQSGDMAASQFNSVMTCPEGSDERHLLLLSKAELGNNDLDLNGRAITYRHNTRYNQKIDPATQAPTSEKLNEDNTMLDERAYNIDIHVLTHSYILNINPLTKVGSGVDYYSGTLCLDYDALIPKGVEVYFIKGVLNKNNVLYENGQKIIEEQFDMHLFGGDGTANKILPANTPVYVKAAKAGLYAFKPITEFNLKGWVQKRNTGDNSTVNILYGMEKSDLRVKSEYVSALAAAKADKAAQTNLLEGYMGEKYTTFAENADSTHKEFYNIDKETVMTGITPRTILTLGREARTGKIGFWPYSGTTLNAHRCYITADAFLAAGGSPASSSARGGASFFFGSDEVTGIQIEERNEPTAVSEDEWYTLQGVRLSGRPLRRGVYIHNGKKEQIQ